MEINIDVVINLYKERLANIENDLIMSQAQVFTLQEKVAKLEGLLKENNIETVKEM